MITVIGASCLDIICQNVSEDVFTSGHEFASNIKMNYGGDGLNQAIILSKLGKQVEFITCVGNDEAGKSIVKYCLDNNVEVIASLKEKTYISTILVDKDGKRNLIGTKDGSLRQLSLNDINEINGDIVSFGSLFISSSMSVNDYEVLFERIKNGNKILCCDSTTIKNNETIDEYKKVLNKIDYFFPNEVEAKLFTRKDDIVKAADVLYDAGIKNVIIKCGQKGCYIKNKEFAMYVPTAERKALDTTGAGDSFVSGFISKLDDGKDIIECLKYANECGGKATQVVGSTNWL